MQTRAAPPLMALGTNAMAWMKDRPSGHSLRQTSLTRFGVEQKSDAGLDHGNTDHTAPTPKPDESLGRMRTKFFGVHPEVLTVFTDGACICNGNKKLSTGGIGVFFGLNDPRNLSEVIDADGSPDTNQKAELLAAIRGVQLARGCNDSSFGNSEKRGRGVHVHVVTDSSYVVKAMNEWAKKWVRNGWRNSSGDEVANAHLMKALYYLKNSGGGASFEHIRGHRNAPSDKDSVYFRKWFGNFMADKLASDAAHLAFRSKLNSFGQRRRK